MKKIYTLISLLVFVALAKTQPTFSWYALPQGGSTTGISSLSYSTTLNGVLVTGGFTNLQYYVSGQTVSCSNLALVKDDGSIFAVDSGITEFTVQSLETSDGTLWAFSKTGLYKREANSWTKVITVDSIRGFADAGNGNVLLMGNFLNVNGTACNNVVRYRPATHTTDTLGLGDGFPPPLVYVRNYVSVTSSDSLTYIMWSVGGMPGAYIYTYDTATERIQLLQNTPAMFYARDIEYSKTTHTLYLSCNNGAVEDVMDKLSNGVWSQVLLFGADATAIMYHSGKLYITGGFYTVNTQQIRNTVIFDEDSSTFAAWWTGSISFLPNCLHFFANGNVIGADGGALWTNFNANSISSVVEDKMFVYPNPATKQLNISTGGITITEINIYNTTGSLVLQDKQASSSSLDISQLAHGVYIAEIKTKEASARRRWVKM